MGNVQEVIVLVCECDATTRVLITVHKWELSNEGDNTLNFSSEVVIKMMWSQFMIKGLKSWSLFDLEIYALTSKNSTSPYD